MKIKERFIDPFTDFGFKKLFGSEPNKDLLIDFLNELLKGKKHIKHLAYSKNEHLGKTVDYRKAIFDLYCESENGEKFIIELQRVKQQYFRDRSIYYATFPIQEQAPEGAYWNYQLKEVYTIGIMDFLFDDTPADQFRHEIKLMETSTKKVFYDKLTFIYLEMPKFEKGDTELTSRFDRWMYLLKNLNNFTEIPSVLQERIFRKVFDIAEVSKLNNEEMKTYEASLKYKRDWKNALDTALDEGREKGRMEGMKEGMKEGIKEGMKEGRMEGKLEGIMEERNRRNLEIAKNLKKSGVTLEIIAESTGLTIEEIQKL